MLQQNHISTTFADSKPHYALLDGLRGVAALLVVIYHIFEGFSFAEVTNAEGDGLIRTLNHGYLAVDFFFMLSGFVISYAYDDRFRTMGTWSFFKRRLIRLHPMLMAGVIIGVITFMLQGSVQWNGSHVDLTQIVLAFVMACVMLPALPGGFSEVRGNGEAFPLNGPSWSLFFEYIGNVLYALFIRRFSTRVLAVFTAAIGLGWAWFALTNVSGYGSMGVGWTIDAVNFGGGLLRMLFPFSLGMLMARNFRPLQVKGAFVWCSLLLVLLFSVPYIPGNASVCLNSVYELFCLLVAFPCVVWLGASGTTGDKGSAAVCNFLGDLSYPLYIIHYPFMYLFYAWLIDSHLYSLVDTWQIAALVVVGCILLAYLLLKCYDIPVRRWLTSSLMKK